MTARKKPGPSDTATETGIPVTMALERHRMASKATKRQGGTREAWDAVTAVQRRFRSYIALRSTSAHPELPGKNPLVRVGGIFSGAGLDSTEPPPGLRRDPRSRSSKKLAPP